MTLTLSIAEMVPYSSVEVRCERRLTIEELDSYRDGLNAIGIAIVELRRVVNLGVDAKLKELGIVLGPDGLRRTRGWRLPKNISSNRYHYYAGGEYCLCGRWKESELNKAGEERNPEPHVDASACVNFWLGSEMAGKKK